MSEQIAKGTLFGNFFNLHPQDAYQHIQQLTNIFSQFTNAFKERIELEIDYSKNLIKISKYLEKYIDSKQSTPISYIASSLKVQHEQRARNSLELADYIHTEIEIPCSTLLMQNRESLKKMEKQLKKLYRQGETVEQIYEKHLKKYQRIHQQWQQKVIAKNIMNFAPGITASQKEKASIKLYQQKRQKEQHQNRYMASLQNFNLFATRYNSIIGDYISQLQTMAMEQITLQMDSMRKLIVSEVNMFKNIEYDLLNISKQMQSLSPKSQIEHFVAEKKDRFNSPILSMYSEGPREVNQYGLIDLKSPTHRSLLDETLLKIDKGIFFYLLENKNDSKIKATISQIIKMKGMQDLSQIQALRDVIQYNKSLKNIPLDGSKSQMPKMNSVTPLCIQVIEAIIHLIAIQGQSQQKVKSYYQSINKILQIHHFYRFVAFTTINQYQKIYEQNINSYSSSSHFLVIVKILLQKSLCSKDIFVARATISLIFSVTAIINEQRKYCFKWLQFGDLGIHNNLDFWLSIIMESTYQLLSLTVSGSGQKSELKQVYLMRQKNVIFSGLLTYCHYMIMLGIQVSFVKSIMYWFSNIYELNKEHQSDLAKTIASTLNLYNQQ